ncbi:SMC-Scp complex subunit ScpB [Laedolimicola ammoniilytica]|uniref:Segregation and condensation protein B n=1 Tax=Laedolimicola ammoniilytica TaxID=2981771 RepID=A0ABT2RYD8_9FIRM|nr:SMC-Scp complex subunit ScpB [Laedolimicola ammoniilytica]MCU6697303.1 SMC-Scp complex subunit ScpB [Laedolimicola ammoniilytica]SCH80558.1 Segregation and condensation protein B [uncultured Clostridium sp.]SCI19186.1 Segregation and condensation protein B [uncultured Clostridium sp.]
MEEKRTESEIRAAVEAILFAAGDSVENERLAEALELDKQEMNDILKRMALRYEEADRGIRLVELSGAWQLCTKTEHYEELIRVVKQPKKTLLTDVLLETLSIVAYKQPVTRLEVEKIRGVKSDHAVNKLVEYGLIEEVGRMDAPGRPILFGTTEEFLRRFGVNSVGELPQATPEQMEDFKEEAEEEAGLEPETSAEQPQSGAL